MNVGLIIPALRCEQTLCDLLGWVDCPEPNGVPSGWHVKMNQAIGISFRKAIQAADEACETQLITQLERWESAARNVASTIAHNPGITLATWAVVGPRDDLDIVRDAVATLQQISCGEVETVNESPSTDSAKAREKTAEQQAAEAILERGRQLRNERKTWPTIAEELEGDRTQYGNVAKAVTRYADENNLSIWKDQSKKKKKS